MPKRTKKPQTKKKAAPRKTAVRPQASSAKRTSAPKASGEGSGRPQTAAPPVLIAGVGASAGGLEAFSELLRALPKAPGFAIVFVQHLAPMHESALPFLLSSRTDLRVLQAEEGMTVERNHVYVIPPNVQMSIRDDVLHLAARPHDHTQYNPIDHFLDSLARAAQERAVGVVLSGTASDGAAGIRQIKAVGGITIAQTPETAKYDGMPRAAIASGVVDLVLTPAEIAAELVSIARHPLRSSGNSSTELFSTEDVDSAEPHMEQIFSLLRLSSGVDFRRYKRPTIDRRLQRRMVLHKQTRLEDYARLLRENPAEVKALYDDILIHVTRFFRDPEVFAALADEVLPKILESRTDDEPIRVWVPGCSTGEEAYSVAILILEKLAEKSCSAPVQVFATDISDRAIDQARSGTYPEGIAEDVSPERLRKYFSRSDHGYRINKSVRDLCIFARQDLTRDPPFSKLDVIVCRNVLIYLGAELQKKLLAVFHYALKPSGHLLLGSAETIGGHSDLFSPSDRKHRIYEKKSGQPLADMQFQIDYEPHVVARPRIPATTHGDEVRSAEGEATRLIQDRYAPPGVIVDASWNVVQFRGQTGSFLEPAPGEPSLHILKMAREGLLHGLREGLQSARKTQDVVRKEGVRVRSNGGWRDIRLEIVPLTASRSVHFLVLFDDVTDGTRKRRDRPGRAEREGSRSDESREKPSRRVARLQQELATSREYLQSIIQDLEAANEELQSANEEVLSANEELQSTNEELDTAKEELQSTNEELNTVNEELYGRNEELSQVNSDLVNLLGNVQIAIVMVANDLRIRRFTPMAERVLNLIPGDIGRPISQIKPNIDCPNLEQLIAKVVDTVMPYESEVRDAQGNLLTLRIRPYKSLESRIDGAVLALFDRHLDPMPAGAQEPRFDGFVGRILDNTETPILILDEAFKIRRANRAFAESFGGGDEPLEERSVFDLEGEEWKARRLRKALESSLRGREAAEDGVRTGVRSGGPRQDRRRSRAERRRARPSAARDSRDPRAAAAG